MNNKYLLYARVSPKGSTWAAEETSIGVQLQRMKEHIFAIDPKAEMIEVVDEFRTGGNMKRPGVQRIMSDLKQRPLPWKCLVVWNLDRLSRSLIDALPVFSLLRDAGAEFISVNQSYLSYTGAMARYMLHQTIAIAELERGMTSERVSAKMRWIAESGKVPFGKVPIGYKRDPEKKNTVIVDPEKAEMIRTIFDLYVSGKLSFNTIHERWNGVIRDRAHLYRILRNPFYMGMLRYNGEVFQGEHEPIIDTKTFQTVQGLLKLSVRQNYQKNGIQKYEYLLSGIVRCHCGRHMTGYSVRKKNQKYFYYKCTSPTCKNAVNAQTLDDGVLKKIVQIFLDEKEIKKSVLLFIESEKQKKSAVCKKLDLLKKDLERAKEKEQKIKDAFLSGIVTRENAGFWNDELFAARMDRERLEKEIAEPETPKIDFETMFPYLMECSKAWTQKILAGEADLATKKNLIMSTINTLECVKRERNKIDFRLSLVMSNSEKWCAHGDSNPGPND